MLFRRRKKEENHKKDIWLADGIYLKEPVLANGNVLLNCFLRALIVFFLVLGTVGGFLSAFELNYNIRVVVIFYLLLSAYFSFLYALPKMRYRDLGYIVFFVAFLGAIYVLRIYANSGFYTIVNTVLNRAQSFFQLSGVREYEVQIDQEYVTVAIVAIFIGMVIMLILNIWMYSTMSLAWTVMFTFPVLLIPLYMKLSPGLLYIVLLSVGYIAVIVFKGNGHYVVYGWDAAFRIRGRKKDRITYTQDASVFRQILVRHFVLFFCLVFSVELFIPSSRFDGWFKEDRLREQTQEIIGNFILLGFQGMYDRYESTGGMSGGKLGGVSSVRPDYQTDLVVSYTPYNADTIYLKGYTGGRYGDNQWESLYNIQENPKLEDLSEDDMGDVQIFEEESLRSEALRLQKNVGDTEQYGAYGVMDVYNVGADGAYLYYPYYTLMPDYTIYQNHSLMPSAQGLRRQEQNTYSYYPKVVWEPDLGEKKPKDIDVSKVDSVFLEVPEKNRDVIEDECQQIGLQDTMSENEIVERVADYFQEEIPYTLRPGATPEGQDFINYFLTKNRKGYCAHFASAATLMFRSMGIPARYVEGYAISYEAALASELNEQKQYADYYWGYSALGETAVLDVEVTDAMAHAWVEIYIDGFGWKPVEVTPSSSETVDEDDDFWSVFGSLLDNTSNNNMQEMTTGIGKVNLQEYFWLVYVMIGVALAMLALSCGAWIHRKYKRYRICHQRDPVEALIACYGNVCDCIRMCDKRFAYCKSHEEQLIYMQMKYEVEMDCRSISAILEEMSFSRNEIGQKELEQVREVITRIGHAIWKKASWRQKWMLVKR